MAVTAAPAATQAVEPLIKEIDAGTELPSPEDIAAFTAAKCAQYAQELGDNGLLEEVKLPDGFASLTLPEQREVLIKLTQSFMAEDLPQEVADKPAPNGNAGVVDLDQALAANKAKGASNQEQLVQTSAPAEAKAGEAKTDDSAPKAETNPPKGKKSKTAKAAKNKPTDGASAKAADDVDPIVSFAQKIEAVKARADIEEIIRDLTDETEKNDFMIGGALARVQENKEWWSESGYESFKDYVETATPLSSYRKGMYCIELYKKIITLDVPYLAFGGLGWSKIIPLMKIVNKDNLAEWVEKAKDMTVLALEANIAEELGNAKKVGDKSSGQPATTTMTFKLHHDQKEIVEDAIKEAMKQVPTEAKTVALEAIAQSYMGTGIAFKKWQDALTYFAKHSSAKMSFAQDVIEHLEKVCPEIVINADVEEKSAVTSEQASEPVTSL